MKCPDCKATEGIQWFLRHQSEGENDTSTTANVLTILCTKCAKNQSVFLQDYLEKLFPEWDNTKEEFQKALEEKYEPVLDEEGNQKTDEVGYPLYQLKEKYKEEKNDNDLSVTSN